jgi:hypothetical protein
LWLCDFGVDFCHLGRDESVSLKTFNDFNGGS